MQSAGLTPSRKNLKHTAGILAALDSHVFMNSRVITMIIGLWCALFHGVCPGLAQNWTNTIFFNDESFHIASSADGKVLIAGGHFVPTNYISKDGGITWITNNSPVKLSIGFASSADGAKLVAIGYGHVFPSASIYTSTNAGAAWRSNNAPSKPWISVASSSDGNKLVAVAGGDLTTSQTWAIYSSTNAGGTWAANNVPTKNWHGVASSADGNKLVATCAGGIYTSTNAGATWTSNSVPSLDWWPVASSVDGNKLVAADQFNGRIFTSSNAGGAWILNNIPMRNWVSVASSADGNKLVAVENGTFGGIYSSTNAGVSWVQNNVTNLAWSSVVSSADGNRLAAAGGRGSIFVSYSTPTPTLDIALINGGALLSWLIPSLNFTLQQSTNLTAGNWLDITNTPVLNLTNLNNEVTLPLSLGTTFYRLKSSP